MNEMSILMAMGVDTRCVQILRQIRVMQERQQNKLIITFSLSRRGLTT